MSLLDFWYRDEDLEVDHCNPKLFDVYPKKERKFVRGVYPYINQYDLLKKHARKGKKGKHPVEKGKPYQDALKNYIEKKMSDKQEEDWLTSFPEDRVQVVEVDRGASKGKEQMEDEDLSAIEVDHCNSKLLDVYPKKDVDLVGANEKRKFIKGVYPYPNKHVDLLKRHAQKGKKGKHPVEKRKPYQDAYDFLKSYIEKKMWDTENQKQEEEDLPKSEDVYCKWLTSFPEDRVQVVEMDGGASKGKEQMEDTDSWFIQC